VPEEADVYNAGIERESYKSYIDRREMKGGKEEFVKFIMHVERRKKG